MSDRPTLRRGRLGDHTDIPSIEVTDDMVNAGLAAIGGFELLDAFEGHLGKADLLRAIYSAMAQAAPHRSL